jgi:hypothetical protein
MQEESKMNSKRISAADLLAVWSDLRYQVTTIGVPDRPHRNSLLTFAGIFSIIRNLGTPRGVLFFARHRTTSE